MKIRKILLLVCFSMLLASCTSKTCEHVDSNNDHFCDLCKALISEHVDLDSNHLCDFCETELSAHFDLDSDHLCDYCLKPITIHIDSDSNHLCEICGQKISEHKNENKDHLCDICGEIVSKCADGNLDGVCDLCGAKVALPEWAHQMPTITINTENSVPIVSKDKYVTAKVSLSNCEEKSYEFENVDAGIRGRGNSTWLGEKKPYRIKFDKKRSMFGREKAKSWVLLANHFDYSLVRNYFFYKLAGMLDNTSFASIAEFVEVIINGVYQGVYIVADQIESGNGRVNLDEDLVPGEDISFLVERNPRILEDPTAVEGIDYIKICSYGAAYEIKTPDSDDKDFLENSEEYTAYIKNTMESLWSMVEQHEDYSKICEAFDVDSFVDGYIVLELGKNIDGMGASTFFYKDKNGKFTFGPLWDFDLAGANSDYNPATLDSEGLYIGTLNWMHYLLEYDEFKALVAQKYSEYQDRILSMIDELDSTSENYIYKKYGDTFERNFVRWDVLGKLTCVQPDAVLDLLSVEEQIEYLKDWIIARNQFMLKTYPVIK